MIEPKGATEYFEYVDVRRANYRVSRQVPSETDNGHLKMMREAEARYFQDVEKCKQSLSLSDRGLLAAP